MSEYSEAVRELSAAVRAFNLSPSIIDIGEALPDWSLNATSAEDTERYLGEYVAMLEECVTHFPALSEIWLENGRHLLGPSAVLVVSILDVKEVGDHRILICDGGRTNQALPSDWEHHTVAPLIDHDPHDQVKTIICGPTCMAYDLIFQGPFSRTATVGDRLIYFNASAYHIPWEKPFLIGTVRRSLDPR